MPEPDPSTPERLRALQSRWEADKTSRVFVQLAEEYRRLGRTEEALAILAEGLTANPNYLAAQVVLGRCHLDLGKTREAIAELEAVISRDPTQMVAYKLLVEAHLAEGDGEEARKRLRIYSLLNDSDPEIADLRRRIGEIGRHRRDPEDTFVGALRAEPAPVEPEAAVPAEAPPIVTDRLDSKVPFPEPTAAEPPREMPAVVDEVLFPELHEFQVRSAGEAASPLLFELPLGVAEPAPAVEEQPEPSGDIAWQLEDTVAPLPEPAEPEPLSPAPVAEPPAPAPAAFDLFDLDVPRQAADLDVTGLLGRSVRMPEPPVVAAEALFELAPPTPEPVAPPAVEEPLFALEAPAAPALGVLAEPEPEPAVPFEPWPVPELELAPEPVPEPAPAAEPPMAAPEPVAEEPAATATLGHLYLRQGHLDEAESIFREVLEREPENASAVSGLAEIAAHRAPPPAAIADVEAPASEPLTAADLLAGFDPTAGGDSPAHKKRFLLSGYLARLRGARGSHVR